MFEFQCGGLSVLRSRRTSAYEIGGEVHVATTSPTRTLPDRKQVSTAKPGRSKSTSSTGELVEGSYVEPGLYTVPYSYGHPLVWLGGNVFGRGLQQLGIGEPDPYHERVA